MAVHPLLLNSASLEETEVEEMVPVDLHPTFLLHRVRISKNPVSRQVMALQKNLAGLVFQDHRPLP